MSSCPTAAVIGDALIDELTMAHGTEYFVGGAALNLATGLQALGHRTTLISQVGSDEGGRLIAAHLADRGVALAKVPSPFGTGVAVSDRTHGEPSYTFNDAMMKRSYAFDSAEIELVTSADITVVNSFPVDVVEQVDRLETLLDKASGLCAYDPNPRPAMIGSKRDFVRGFDRIAALCTLVKISDEDAAWMFGMNIDEAIDRTLDLGAGMVLATSGAAGATMATAAGIRVGRPIVTLPGPIVDTMGAGDSTLASLLWAIAKDGTDLTAVQWSAHLDFAMTIAALTCRSVGADIQLPTGL